MSHFAERFVPSRYCRWEGRRFSVGRGQLVDEEGIDCGTDVASGYDRWFDRTCLRAVAQEINPSAELWATFRRNCRNARGGARSHYPEFRESRIVRSFAGAARYAGPLRRFVLAIRNLPDSMTPDTNGARDLLTQKAYAASRWCCSPALTRTFHGWLQRTRKFFRRSPF
jgi:hypothetical protein